MIELTFLGTSSMVPTKERNQTSIFLKFDIEGILIDCGEGTQNQLKKAGIKPSKVTKIIISHWHGDHVLGIPGLIQTLSKTGYEETLHIYGPVGTEEKLKLLFDVFDFDNQLKIEVHNIKEGPVIDNKKYSIKAYTMHHGVECFGFRFEEKDRLRIDTKYTEKIGIKPGPQLGKLQEGKDVEFEGKKIKASDATYVVKGKVIGFVTDTDECTNCIKVAQDADLLISESTYITKDEDKAREYNHLTTQQAAQIATQANVKKLIVTHISPRYTDINEIEEDIQIYFKDAKCAYDFMKVRV